MIPKHENIFQTIFSYMLAAVIISAAASLSAVYICRHPPFCMLSNTNCNFKNRQPVWSTPPLKQAFWQHLCGTCVFAPDFDNLLTENYFYFGTLGEGF